MTMIKKNIPLNSDKYIISLDNDIFKVSRFKDIVLQNIRQKLMMQIFNAQQESGGTIIKLFKQINIANENIEISTIEFTFLKDCQLLYTGSDIWHQGKLKVAISLSPIGKHADQIYLEFLPYSADEINSSEHLSYLTPSTRKIH